MEEQVREMGLTTQFAGRVPDVPTATQVDVEALTAGDSDPMFVTLQVAESGRLSQNRLRYDDGLLNVIAEQMVGADARMGHVPEGAQNSVYPVTTSGSVPLAGHWVGSSRDGNVLWGKAYIPPGEVREYIRRLKATGGKLGTSIYGRGAFEAHNDGSRRLKAFLLESVDFAPPNRAALPLSGAFAVTAEMTDEGNKNQMDNITINDVPEVVREQIIQQAQGAASMERVAELEQQNAELRGNAEVVAELQQTLGQSDNLTVTVREMHDALVAIAEAVQVTGDSVQWGDVRQRVTELHQTVAEMRAQQFEVTLNEAVAETTVSWKNVGDDPRVKALHAQVRSAALAQLADDRSAEAVAEAVKTAWASESIQVIAEAVKSSIAGPPAFVGGKGKDKSASREDLFSEEARRNRANRFGL